MKDTTSRGDLTEFEIATALMRSGKKLLRPLSAGRRYDIAIDNGDGTIDRVQCKTGQLKNGVIQFKVCMTDGRRPRGVPYHGQVEAFGVFCPQSGRAYLVPIGAVADRKTIAALRIAPTRNGQAKGVRFAETYEIHANRLPIDAPREEIEAT